MSAQTMNLEDIVIGLDDQYKLSPYLMLRGSVSYRAAKLAGQYCAKLAKLFMIEQEQTGLDAFNAAMGTKRGDLDNDKLSEEAGMEIGDMLENLKSLVMYSNKLNFDMQTIVDPTGNRRNVRGFIQRGVYFNDREQRASWESSVKLVSESGQTKDVTYEEYVESLDDPEWAITKTEFDEQNTDDMTMYEVHKDEIVDLILMFGDGEIDFGDLPIRTQIGLIENMRGKIERMQASALKTIRFSRMDKHDKVAEATKMKKIIGELNQILCDMLDAPRYANYAEFMYGYIPNAESVPAQPISRRIIAKSEAKLDEQMRSPGRVDDKTAEKLNTAADEHTGETLTT